MRWIKIKRDHWFLILPHRPSEGLPACVVGWFYKPSQTRAHHWTLRSTRGSLFREWKIFWRCSTRVDFWVVCGFQRPTSSVASVCSTLSESNMVSRWTSSDTSLFSVMWRWNTAAYISDSHARNCLCATTSLCGACLEGGGVISGQTCWSCWPTLCPTANFWDVLKFNKTVQSAQSEMDL